MKYTPGFTDFFISPVTGKFITNTSIPLQEDYILIGGKNGYSIESPALIDVRLDIISLRSLLATAKFLLQEAQEGLDNAQALNLVRNGMISNLNGVIVPTTLTENYIWVGDADGYPVETPIGSLPPSLPSLPTGNIWIGDINNQAHPQPIIVITNLPNLTNQNIWRGDGTNRPVESTAVTDLESQTSTLFRDLSDLANIVNAISSTVNALSNAVDAIETGIAGIGGFAAILLLQAQVLGLYGALSGITSRIDDIDNQIANINSQINIINSRIDNLRLNNIPADGDVSIYNFRLINVEDPINPQDAATKYYVDNAISGIPGSIIITLGGAVSGSGASNTTINTTFNLTLNQIANAGDINVNNYKIIELADPINPQDAVNLRTLEGTVGALTLTGFVLGGPPVDGVITTSRGPTCLLTNIPAGGNVDLGNYRIINLADAEAQYDAVNYNTMWELFNSDSFFAKYIAPELNVLGPRQQFIFNQNNVWLELYNTFQPTSLINSKSNHEMTNSNLSGYRIVQETTIEQNSGDFYIERFINAQESGNKFFGFDESLEQPVFYENLSMNNNAINNVADMPPVLIDSALQNAINFEWMWKLLNDEVL